MRERKVFQADSARKAGCPHPEEGRCPPLYHIRERSQNGTLNVRTTTVKL